LHKSLATQLYPKESGRSDFRGCFVETPGLIERKNPSPCTPDLTMLNLQHYRNPITGIFQELILILSLLSGISVNWKDIMNLFYGISVSPALKI